MDAASSADALSEKEPFPATAFCLSRLGPAMLKGVRLLFAAMLVATLHVGAKAHEWPVKRIGPDYDNASCIGDYSIPRCAVESFLACIYREKPELCIPLGFPAPNFTRSDERRRYIEYQIIAVQPVDPQLTAKLLGDDISDWLGVYEVRAMERSCDEGRDCNTGTFMRNSYYLKSKGEGWKMFRTAEEEEYGFSCDELDDTLPPSAFGSAICDHLIEERIMPWVHVEEWK